MKGLYIHVPFCPTKCPYCDFYSLSYSKTLKETFVKETLKRLKKINERFDTVYFGGGTPSLLGSESVREILSEIDTDKNAEITLESNPNMDFTSYKESGVNRISLGLQSANEDELKFLGRNHTAEQAKKSIYSAFNAGIENISLDLMIGLPNMTRESLSSSIEFCKSNGASHVSSYILKIEENTPFYDMDLSLPSEDEIGDLYLFMAEELEKKGYMQYEISNFSKEGFESRHNLKYWNCQEYLALGPSAHMFSKKKRMYFPRDLEYYLSGKKPLFDDEGGDFEEFLMLKLRLTKGVSKNECEKYGSNLFNELLQKSKQIGKEYINFSDNNISFTKKGFLVSNYLLTRLIF